MKSLNRGRIIRNEMTMNGKNRNKPCPCDSGIKYKLCHGKIQLVKIEELLKKEEEKEKDKKEAEKLKIEVVEVKKMTELNKNNPLV